jgi:cytidylate kinase
MSNSDALVVAVDGPSASGKSTVSKRVAQELGYIYVDSGALYRGITWKAVREGIDVKDAEAVLNLIRNMDLVLHVQDKVVGFTIDGEDPGEQIRSGPVRERVSDVAVIPEVRAYIVDRLREMVRFGPLAMEGRDIGSVVFPNARHKFYLDADPEERARRRHEELLRAEGKSDVNEVLNSLQRRDRKDTTRETAPLQIALGARVINSTAMDIEDVVKLVVKEVTAARESG